jgi:Amidases related to nicotinamidase
MKQLQNPCLIIIDVQKAFEHPKWGRRNNPFAEKNIAHLLLFWRKHHWPVIHVRHASGDSRSLFWVKSDTFHFKEEVQPQDHEEIITKQVNSAFIGTELENKLCAQQITTLVITGLTLPHCVSTTIRMGSNLGFKMILVSDATASFPLKTVDGRLIPAEEIQ